MTSGERAAELRGMRRENGPDLGSGGLQVLDRAG